MTDNIERARGLPVAPAVRARTLITLLWRKQDAAGISMGRTYESVVLEAAMDLLGDPDVEDVRRLEEMNGSALLQETRDYLSAVKARREGLTVQISPNTTSFDQPAAGGDDLMAFGRYLVDEGVWRPEMADTVDTYIRMFRVTHKPAAGGAVDTAVIRARSRVTGDMNYKIADALRKPFADIHDLCDAIERTAAPLQSRERDERQQQIVAEVIAHGVSEDQSSKQIAERVIKLCRHMFIAAPRRHLQEKMLRWLWKRWNEDEPPITPSDEANILAAFDGSQKS